MTWQGLAASLACRPLTCGSLHRSAPVLEASLRRHIQGRMQWCNLRACCPCSTPPVQALLRALQAPNFKEFADKARKLGGVG